MVNRLVRILLSIATTLALAYSMFGVGFLVCTSPGATNMVGSTFSGWEHSVFPEEDMAAIAESVRSFAIDGTDSEQLYNQVTTAIEENYPALADVFNQGYVDTSESEALSAITGSDSLADLEEEYSFPQSALSHLADCTPLFTTVTISIGVVCGAAIIGLIVIGIFWGRRDVGKVMIGASSLLIVLLFALGIWAIVDFNSLFTFMHLALFPQGNWTFPADSLLIRLFPEAFWLMMAVLWLAISIATALIVGLAGRIIGFGARRRRK